MVTAGSFHRENVTDSLLRLYADLCAVSKSPTLTERPAFFSEPGTPTTQHLAPMIAGAAKNILGAAVRLKFISLPSGPTQKGAAINAAPEGF